MSEQPVPKGSALPPLTVTVPLTPAYANPYVNIASTSAQLTIPLVGGVGTVSTGLQNVGTLTYFQDPVLQALITLWYSFDPTSNTLTLCGNDLVSSDATSVTTVPRGTDQTCVQHTYAGDNNPCNNNPNWNYCAGLTPGLQQALQQSVRTANQAVIDAALSSGLTVIVRTPPPEMSFEMAQRLALVYRNGTFLEMHDPAKKYDNDCTIRPVQSVWYGEIYLTPMENFANVIGSTGDGPIAGLSWLQLWVNQFQPVSQCSSLNYNGFPCTSTLYGRHVLLGQVATNVPYGANNVFIMPICASHNNNNGVYMAAVTQTKGIALANYHNP